MKFKNLRKEIQESLLNKINQNNIVDEKGFALIEGFLTFSVDEGFEHPVIGGRTLPAVGIVAETSGQLHIFSLKIILPDLKI